MLPIDLNKKIFFARTTVTSGDKKLCNVYIKVCTNPKVSPIKLILRKTSKNTFLNSDDGSSSRSADACATVLEKTLLLNSTLFKNLKTKVLKYRVLSKICLHVHRDLHILFVCWKTGRSSSTQRSPESLTYLRKKHLKNQKFLKNRLVNSFFQLHPSNLLPNQAVRAVTPPKEFPCKRPVSALTAQTLIKNLENSLVNHLSRTHPPKLLPNRAVTLPKELFCKPLSALTAPTLISISNDPLRNQLVLVLVPAINPKLITTATPNPRVQTLTNEQRKPHRKPHRILSLPKPQVLNPVYTRSKPPKLLSSSHATLLISLDLLRSNVERNPGPDVDLANPGVYTQSKQLKASVLVTSLNVRGLKEDRKLRHLTNHFSKKTTSKDTDLIACFQETYIESPGLIPYIWRGNYHLTPGIGNSCGCLTLLSAHLSVVASRDIENRAHVLACQKSGDSGVTYIILNLYAPNPNSNEKIEFYETIFESLREFEEAYECNNLIVLGDFNLNFDRKEMKNRMYTQQEQRISTIVKTHLEDLNLFDVWEKESLYTWRRANTDMFSTIDRIALSKCSFKVVSKGTDWSLSFSDHAAVEVGLERLGRTIPRKTRITRLDPSLTKIPKYRLEIEQGYNEMMEGIPPDWDPHTKLEFAKVCIRTVVERVQADRKKTEVTEEDSLNEELNRAIDQLATGSTTGRTENLIEFIEDLRNRKNHLIDLKGERLAEKLGTQWYNEGEKSTKYFLRILHRNMPDDFKELVTSDGDIVSDNQSIENEIVKFYKNLYEDGNVLIEDDETFFDLINPISGEAEDEISKPITVDELRKTLHSCTDSSPGPDGIPYSIIGMLWSSFGPILCEAWNYSLLSSKLPPSHKTSYLKLIPKAGKDLKKLTNWRPITLSNCDHKLITKTYSKRLCSSLAASISEVQTAYIPGRLINDNVRSVIATINATVEDENKGLLVALDARKAFDSVEHSYIELCLRKFGCAKFIPIFRTLYRELRTDILINGRVVKGYNINRGVKQGDALSCIIFIMCMEPLIRNLENNQVIEPIRSITLNSSLPKVYAYADDVNATIKDTLTGAKQIFKEYQRLTKLSGLQLNADKTEIMRFGKSYQETFYTVTYLGQNYDLKLSSEIKINGILFQNNVSAMSDVNVDKALSRMSENLKKWSRRSLTTLGKILIIKTFGISLIIHIMQSLTLNEIHVKKINHVLYKFIWNRHFLASKAPERISRMIVNKPVKLGGLGMLDVAELDASLKIKALGRLLSTNHPFLNLIRNRLDLSCFFTPKCTSRTELIAVKACEFLKRDRENLWSKASLQSSAAFLGVVSNTETRDLLNLNGKNSIPYFIQRRNGVRLVKDLNEAHLRALSRYLVPEKFNAMSLARRLNVPTPDILDCVLINNRFKKIANCTSKEIRSSRADNNPLTTFKLGLQISPKESINLFNLISKLTNTKHKNTILKALHGELYTKEKLYRFGLIDSPDCPRCNQIETLKHKLLECEYTKRIWSEVNKKFPRMSTPDPIRNLVAIPSRDNDLIELTVHAELLQRIMSLPDNQNYLIHPRMMVKLTIKHLVARERKEGIKMKLRDLL